MKKKMKSRSDELFKYLILFQFLFWSLGTTYVEAASTPIAKIYKLSQEETGVKVVLKDVPFHNPNGCAKSDYYFLNKNHPQYEENLSAMLLAIAGRYEVQFWIYDLSCDLDYPIISSTRIHL